MVEAFYRPRPCPVCGADSARARDGVHSARRAEESPPAELRADWSGFFREKRFFSYARCQACGLLYAPRYFTDVELSGMYAQMSDNTAGVDLAALRRTQRGYFKHLDARPLAGDYLEIGPDIGLFTECAVRTEKFNKYWLYEPNQAVHEQLRARLRGRPHAISTALLDLSAVPDAAVGAAVMVHVLDHILEPRAFLQALRAKLRPDATLLIVTHDERSGLARALGRRWPAYCLQHPHLFNPDSMRALLERSGFETRSVAKSVNRFPVTYLARHLLFALGLGRWPLPKWDAFQVPLRLGNILTVATVAQAAGAA